MTTGAQTPLPPARPKRSRLRTFLPLGLAVWLVLEIWLLTLVAGALAAEAARPGSEGNGLMMLGGLLLMIPGLASDAVGLLLLLPPVQKAVSRSAERTFERKLREARPGTLGGAFQQARMHQPDGKVVQGEVIRDEPGDTPQPPRPPLTH